MTKLIIFEGADNVGKTTAINRFLTEARNERSYILKMHNSKPAPGEDPFGRYQLKLEQQLTLRPDYIVWDRAIFSAYVYEGYYRAASFSYVDAVEYFYSLTNLVETKCLLLTRSWKNAKADHEKELAESVDDPNFASIKDRQLIHTRWHKLANSLKQDKIKHVQVIEQEW